MQDATKSFNRKWLAAAVAGICAAGSATSHAAPSVVETAPVSMQAPNGKMQVKLSAALKQGEGSIAAIVAPVADRKKKTDITPIVVVDGETVNLDFANSPIGEGHHRVRLFLVSLEGKWTEMGAVTVVPGEAGAAAPDPNAKPAFVPKLDVAVAAQVLERARGSAERSTRPHYTNLTMQGGFETNHLGDDWEVKSQVQLAGSSFRQEAPNFGKLGANAPNIDIASYLVEGGYKDSRLAVGHISVDTHPLITSGLSNRGVQFQQKLPLGVDMAISIQNGESVVGYRNLAGLAQRNNQHRSFGLGYDIYPSKPGNFRLDFNSGENRVFNGTAPDGHHLYDQSHAHGGRAIWRNEAGSLRMEAVLAKSEFEAASPAPGAPHKVYGHARTFEAGADPIKDKQLTDKLPLSLTLAYRNEYSSPFYKSLGSGFGSNFRLNIETATVKLGNVQMQWQATQRYDNVAEDRLYIRNKVRANTFSMTLPIAQFFVENLGSKQKFWFAKPDAPAPAAPSPAAAPPATPPTPSATPAPEAAPAPSTAPATTPAEPTPAPTPPTAPTTPPTYPAVSLDAHHFAFRQEPAPATPPTPPTPAPTPTDPPPPPPAAAPAAESAPASAAPAAPATPAPTAETTAAPAAPASIPEQPAKISPWWPAITFNQQLNHGFADPGYIPNGFGIADLPNVRVTNRAWGFAWTFEKFAFGWKSNKTDNRNHQPGKENLSTLDRRYSANAEWKVTEKLTLGVTYDPSYNYRFESNTKADARQLRGNVSWNITEEWQLTGEMNHSADYESTSPKYNRVNASQMQLARRFQLNVPGWKKLPTQFYLRATESRGFNNTGTGQILEPRVTRVQLGVTITLF